MGEIYDFFKLTLKEHLGLPMSSVRYDTLVGSRNIFSNYKDDTKYHYIGYGCAEAFKTVVFDKIGNNKVLKYNIYKYFMSYLSGLELEYAENNPDDLETIIDFILMRYSSPDDKEFISKIVTPKKKRLSSKDNEYARRIKKLFDNVTNFLIVEKEAAAVLMEKIISEICTIVKKRENLPIDTDNDFLFSKNILPTSIVMSIKNIENSLIVLEGKESTLFIDEFLNTGYINLRIIVKWFLNHYLKVKNTNYKIHSDLYPKYQKSSFRIVDLYELFDLGWTLDEYMIQCMKLWDEYTDVPHELSGDEKHWVNLLNENPELPRILLDENDNFVGFWDFVPVYDELFEKIKTGDFAETELSIDKIPVLLHGMYKIYFIGMCIKKEYRKKLALQKILFSVMEVFEELALNGIFIEEICVWASSNPGISLCKNLGLNHLIDHKEMGRIYNGTMQDIFNKHLSGNFKTLKALYEEKKLI